MKKSVLILIMGLALLFASGETKTTTPAAQPAYSNEILIDNFDDGDITNDPTWWTFDKAQVSFPEAKDGKYGLYSMKVTGKVDNYYLGGMGTYVGKDVYQDDTLVISVYGTGKDSGKIKIQLFDDDNNTYQLEQDSTFKPLADDQFEYELPVTWEGWRTVEIPLSKFVDVNPGIGDDVWNPDTKNGSGGLLHFQMVFLAPTQKGAVNLMVDNIRLVKKAE
jgi:hypothetical protein